MTANQFKAFLSDVDGTILTPDLDGEIGLPSEKVTQAIRKVSKLLPTGLVTARQPRKALELAKYLEMSGYCIFSNGAQIYDLKNNQLIVEHILDSELVKKISSELLKYKVLFWIQDNGIDNVVDQNIDKYKNLPGDRTYLKIEDYKCDKPFIIVIREVAPDYLDKVLEMISAYKSITAFNARQYPSGNIDIYITDVFSNKQSAVIEIAKLLNIDSKEILAIGDGANDVVLMEACTGVAMGNAVEPTKKAAVWVAPSIQEDGVAAALEKYIL